MAQTTPNQILHYTASAANYPTWAIRVGNFALTDVGNNVKGSWGTFRMGLNPKAFTAIDAEDGLDKQTYTVYIYKPDGPGVICAGPACYLIDEEKKIPNPDDDYPGNNASSKPWYHLIRLKSWIQKFSASTGTFSSPLNYDEGFTDNTSQILPAGVLNNAFLWFRDQLSLSDPNLYSGGTAGNRIVVNKFYPPIIVSTASRIYDASYVASMPHGYGLAAANTSKFYNLVGFTHGVFTQGEDDSVIHEWDPEGGSIRNNDSTATHLFKIQQDLGFNFLGASQPQWTLNMYFNWAESSTNYNNWLITSQDTQPNASGNIGLFWGLGVREISGQQKLFYTSQIDSGGTRNDFPLTPGTVSLNRWYFVSVVHDISSSTSTYRFFINGKKVDTHTGSPWAQSFASGWANCSVFLGPAGLVDGKNFQYLSYYPVTSSDNDVRENFLRYALNSKIRNSDIRIALDTGTKASHLTTTKWIDISGYYRDATPTTSFTVGGYKPQYLEGEGTITHNSDLALFASEPFCLSIWFYSENISALLNIFNKSTNYFEIRQEAGGNLFVKTSQNGTGSFQNAAFSIDQSKWYNIFVTGTSLTDVKVYLYTHSGGTEDFEERTLTGSGITDPTVANSSNITISETTASTIRIASIIYWKSRFNENLCREFFSIQKGRFGYDTWTGRIANTGSCE
jgi:hypothetical protein